LADWWSRGWGKWPTLDIAFVFLVGDVPPGVTATVVSEDPLAVVCAVHHRLAGRRSVSLRALRDESFVEFPPAWGTRVLADRAFAAAGIERRVAFEVNDTTTVLRLVAQGLGVALMSRAAGDAGLAVVWLPLRPAGPVYRLAVVAPERPSAAARALIQQLNDSISAESSLDRTPRSVQAEGDSGPRGGTG
jgi:DNA-binding transcriptional LysR family regulator